MLSTPLLLTLVALAGGLVVMSVTAPAPSAGPRSLVEQLTGQLALAVNLDAQQRALLVSVAERSRDALASVVFDQLERRLALLDHLERAVAAPRADAVALHAVARSWRAIREGRLTALAAGLAVAMDVDSVLSPAQRAALDRFSPRLSMPRSTEGALRSLLEHLERAGRAQTSQGGPSETTIGAVETDLEALLAQLPLPVDFTPMVVRHVGLSLRLAGRPEWEGAAGVLDLSRMTRMFKGVCAAFGERGEGPRPVFAAMAELLDSPLLPAVAQPGRLKRHALELVMIS